VTQIQSYSATPLFDGMCGIFCTISHEGHVSPTSNAALLLQERGPDCFKEHRIALKDQAGRDIYLSCSSSVLSLRGQRITPQPLVDQASGCVLCWNGEAWKLFGNSISGNDGVALFQLLVQASLGTESQKRILDILANIRGPFALVFYDGQAQRLYFGRDCLGRRSLLTATTATGTVLISSVADLTLDTSWAEIEAEGIRVYDLCQSNVSRSSQATGLVEILVPYTFASLDLLSEKSVSIVSMTKLSSQPSSVYFRLYHTPLLTKLSHLAQNSEYRPAPLLFPTSSFS
jgi:asparagine synthetase B (glutamine-hydrolysing)